MAKKKPDGPPTFDALEQSIAGLIGKRKALDVKIVDLINALSEAKAEKGGVDTELKLTIGEAYLAIRSGAYSETESAAVKAWFAAFGS